MKTEAGLYIHIPFCSSECGYCAFAKQEDSLELKKDRKKFIGSLIKELEIQFKKYSSELNFTTLYIGGGTPSLLNSNEVRELINNIRHIVGGGFKEISYDCNPEDLVNNKSYVQVLDEVGVNRLTIGVQTLSSIGLTVLERKANKENIIQMAEELPNQFSGQISYDLILGWPKQTVEEFIMYDEPFLKKHKFDHLSLYLLNVEPGTRLKRDIKHKRLSVISDDDSANIWEKCLAVTRECEMHQYEISSFCKNGKKSLHNTNTWKGLPYLGIGPGAVSRVGTNRWTNTKIYDKYMRKINQNESATETVELINAKIAWQDELIFSMRHEEGIDLDAFNNRHKLDLYHIAKSNIECGIKEKHLSFSGNILKFTPLGWNYFDAYISDWMNLLD
jgi:putative oxygen-independent coproporphyrinogen III oxidase